MDDWNWVPQSLVLILAIVEAVTLFHVWKARDNVKELKIQLNSRLSELIKASRDEALGFGHAAGVESERVRSERKEDSDE